MTKDVNHLLFGRRRIGHNDPIKSNITRWVIHLHPLDLDRTYPANYINKNVQNFLFWETMLDLLAIESHNNW